MQIYNYFPPVHKIEECMFFLSCLYLNLQSTFTLTMDNFLTKKIEILFYAFIFYNKKDYLVLLKP